MCVAVLHVLFACRPTLQEEGVKTQQMLCSVPRIVLWIATLLWDFIQYLFLFGGSHTSPVVDGASMCDHGGGAALCALRQAWRCS
jgi:hypothetical protein